MSKDQRDIQPKDRKCSHGAADNESDELPMIAGLTRPQILTREDWQDYERAHETDPRANPMTYCSR